MERKIRGKFILFSSLSVLLMIMTVIGLSIFIGYFTTYSKIYSDLEYLCDNYDKIKNENDSITNIDNDNIENMDKKTEVMFSPELQYEFRYFIVTIQDEVKVADVSHISVISDDDAVLLAEKVIRHKTGRSTKRGTIDYDSCSYAYKIMKVNDDRVVVFLDSTRTIYNVHRVIKLAVLIGVLSFLFFFLIRSAFSGRAVKSTIKNIEAQNEFITNAGHELKTPLAIISANTEVIEMLSGKNEWTEGIIHQVKRMNNLIGGLIFLAKMNEKTDIVLQNMDFSAVVTEVTQSFKGMVEQQEKSLEVDISENILIRGEEKIVHELVSILMDNAVKYCDEQGKISVILKKRTREIGARLVIRNPYAEGKNVDYSRFFNRFYREDTSHNSKKNGYGIGLSMAEGIVRRLKGKITVSYHDGDILFTVLL